MPLPQSFIDALPAIQSVRNANPLRNKALVVIYLGGGADNHNTVIPRTGANRAAYDAARPTARIAAGTELPLTTDWGLHPSLTKLKSLWDANKLAVVANCGPLAEPATKTRIVSGDPTLKLPSQLSSHSDQDAQWQVGKAGAGFSSNTGWVGRAFDLTYSVYNASNLSLGELEFAYSPVRALAGNEVNQFSLGAGFGPGTRSLAGTVSGVSSAFDAVNSSIAASLPFAAVTDFANTSTADNANAVILKAAHDATTNPAGTPAFPSSSIAQQLRTTARMIAAQSAIGHERSVIYNIQGGFDQHADLLAVLQSNYNTLNAALESYDSALTELGIRDRVVTLIYTEFGRSLVQNSTGTDHAWGGNVFVFGQDVIGGFYGTLPNLALNGPDMYDTRGYLIPTTSFETIYATILRWYGIPDATANGVNPMKLVLPNIDNFPTRNLGFLPPMLGT